MYTYKIYNNIAEDGIEILAKNDLHIDEINPDSLLIRSQVLTDGDLNQSLKCIGRAGAGTNNVPVIDATNKGIVVFNTPGANANAVKELVVCGMLLSSGVLFREMLTLKHCLAKTMHCLTPLWSLKRRILKAMN